jgi:hypothetical protein
MQELEFKIEYINNGFVIDYFSYGSITFIYFVN